MRRVPLLRSIQTASISSSFPKREGPLSDFDAPPLRLPLFASFFRLLPVSFFHGTLELSRPRLCRAFLRNKTPRRGSGRTWAGRRALSFYAPVAVGREEAQLMVVLPLNLFQQQAAGDFRVQNAVVAAAEGIGHMAGGLLQKVGLPGYEHGNV